MKRFVRVLLLMAVVVIIGLFACAEDVSAQICLHSGCKQKCYKNDRYCYKHRIDSPSKNNSKKTKNSYKNSSQSKKSTGSKYSSKKKKTTKKSYVDEMPDCDDYDNWGEFMDDWDGNMPDGSDASDYWDNW